MKYQFADCVLDCARHRLIRAGQEVHAEPQVFALLQLLAENAGQVVTRDAIVDRVWSGRIVSEAAISARISSARAAVGDDGKSQRIIRTVTRVGLELVVPVKVGSAAPVPQPTQIRMTTSHDGTGLCWATAGQGAPVMRASHWLSHLELDPVSPVWAPLLDRLGAGRQLVRYDQRSTGLSQRDCPSLTLDDLVMDLMAVADAAGLERFSIYAVSQSVPVSIAAAARHPERIKSMVLQSGYAEGSLVRDRRNGKALTDTFLQLIQSGWGQPGSPFMNAFTSLFMPGGTPEQIENFVQMQLQSISPEGAVALRRAISEFDVTDVLEHVACPVLVCHGRLDGVHPFDQSQHLAREIKDARFIPYDSANHVFLPQSPEWPGLVAQIDAFLTETA